MDREAHARGLTESEAAVLGLLAFGEASGYDLIRKARESVGFFWAPARSRIYSLLPELERVGLATRQDVRQAQRPDKAVYRITEAGRASLEAWLESPPGLPPAPRNAFLLRLFLGSHAAPDVLVEQVRSYRERVRAELAQLERLEVDRDEELYGWLTLQFGLERMRATLDWADMAVTALEQRVRT